MVLQARHPRARARRHQARLRDQQNHASCTRTLDARREGRSEKLREKAGRRRLRLRRMRRGINRGRCPAPVNGPGTKERSQGRFTRRAWACRLTARRPLLVDLSVTGAQVAVVRPPSSPAKTVKMLLPLLGTRPSSAAARIVWGAARADDAGEADSLSRGGCSSRRRIRRRCRPSWRATVRNGAPARVNYTHSGGGLDVRRRGGPPAFGPPSRIPRAG